MEMWFSEFHTPDVKHSIRVNRQLYSKQSDYQRIDIFETPEFGRVLTLDGNVMLTERDEFIYDEMITHVPMAVHKEARDILVIGAGDGGVVRELTRYDRVRHIDLVEMDPLVVEACRAYLPENACRLDDRRVHLHYENALKFIRRCEGKYDLIIVDSSDPFGPSEGLFTREFYGNCYNALKDDGINYQNSVYVEAWDLDMVCALMAYIQFSLYGIPAIVVHGNSITQECYSEWYTPGCYNKDFISKLKIREKLEVLKEIFDKTQEKRKSKILMPSIDEKPILNYESISLF